MSISTDPDLRAPHRPRTLRDALTFFSHQTFLELIAFLPDPTRHRHRHRHRHRKELELELLRFWKLLPPTTPLAHAERGAS